MPMIRFRLLGMPVGVQPWFFVMAWFIGGRSQPLPLIVWIVAVFVGVMAHELGHALAVRRCGLRPAIVLHGFGGATTWSGRELSLGRRAAVTAAGPAAGIGLGLVVLAVQSALGVPSSHLGGLFLRDLWWVSLGWGVLNLLPVLPLDGGVLLGTAAEAVAGPRGLRAARVASVLITLGLAGWAVVAGEIWLAILGAVLTAINVQALRERPLPVPATISEERGRDGR